ncbi:Nif11-like leader peptide family natural product precursor [Candidatus Thiosymbion oneisti]|uniref:Nif11-like leader peptide family natural product precursor n=1 Tax=Candidatus Thiosymbion oneisti TaxID=589554 RepID=UPI000B7DE7AE|nr:Nif11-like leader peptide family natural product precursor [Candidatus Thiosymbion oneisti]
MSVKNALQFIVQLRADEELSKQLVFSDGVPELESLVRLGDKIGLSFTVEELRVAHKHDWGMRYISCSRSTPTSGS